MNEAIVVRCVESFEPTVDGENGWPTVETVVGPPVGCLTVIVVAQLVGTWSQ